MKDVGERGKEGKRQIRRERERTENRGENERDGNR
jgi:hypothetical protein